MIATFSPAGGSGHTARVTTVMFLNPNSNQTPARNIEKVIHDLHSKECEGDDKIMSFHISMAGEKVEMSPTTLNESIKAVAQGKEMQDYLGDDVKNDAVKIKYSFRDRTNATPGMQLSKPATTNGSTDSEVRHCGQYPARYIGPIKQSGVTLTNSVSYPPAVWLVHTPDGENHGVGKGLLWTSE